MSKIHFTADTHFDHANIIKYCKRPFDDVSHMNEELILRWNSRVQPGDCVYHLGDFSFSKDPNRWKTLCTRLNGQIFLIKGNHDYKRVIKEVEGCFGWVRDYYQLRYPDPIEGKKPIILMHYAMRVWNHSHHGSYHLYGHSHGSLPDDKHARSMDVGVDCNNFYPFSYEEIKKHMNKKEYQFIDHHGDPSRKDHDKGPK